MFDDTKITRLNLLSVRYVVDTISVAETFPLTGIIEHYLKVSNLIRFRLILNFIRAKK